MSKVSAYTGSRNSKECAQFKPPITVKGKASKKIKKKASGSKTKASAAEFLAVFSSSDSEEIENADFIKKEDLMRSLHETYNQSVLHSDEQTSILDHSNTSHIMPNAMRSQTDHVLREKGNNNMVRKKSKPSEQTNKMDSTETDTSRSSAASSLSQSMLANPTKSNKIKTKKKLKKKKSEAKEKSSFHQMLAAFSSSDSEVDTRELKKDELLSSLRATYNQTLASCSDISDSASPPCQQPSLESSAVIPDSQPQQGSVESVPDTPFEPHLYIEAAHFTGDPEQRDNGVAVTDVVADSQSAAPDVSSLVPGLGNSTLGESTHRGSQSAHLNSYSIDFPPKVRLDLQVYSSLQPHPEHDTPTRSLTQETPATPQLESVHSTPIRSPVSAIQLNSHEQHTPTRNTACTSAVTPGSGARKAKHATLSKANKSTVGRSPMRATPTKGTTPNSRPASVNNTPQNGTSHSKSSTSDANLHSHTPKGKSKVNAPRICAKGGEAPQKHTRNPSKISTVGTPDKSHNTSRKNTPTNHRTKMALSTVSNVKGSHSKNKSSKMKAKKFYECVEFSEDSASDGADGVDGKDSSMSSQSSSCQSQSLSVSQDDSMTVLSQRLQSILGAKKPRKNKTRKDLTQQNADSSSGSVQHGDSDCSIETLNERLKTILAPSKSKTRIKRGMAHSKKSKAKSGPQGTPKKSSSAESSCAQSAVSGRALPLTSHYVPDSCGDSLSPVPPKSDAVSGGTLPPTLHYVPDSCHDSLSPVLPAASAVSGGTLPQSPHYVPDSGGDSFSLIQTNDVSLQVSFSSPAKAEEMSSPSAPSSSSMHAAGAPHLSYGGDAAGESSGEETNHGTDELDFVDDPMDVVDQRNISLQVSLTQNESLTPSSSISGTPSPHKDPGCSEPDTPECTPVSDTFGGALKKQHPAVQATTPTPDMIHKILTGSKKTEARHSLNESLCSSGSVAEDYKSCVFDQTVYSTPPQESTAVDSNLTSRFRDLSLGVSSLQCTLDTSGGNHESPDLQEVSYRAVSHARRPESPTKSTADHHWQRSIDENSSFGSPVSNDRNGSPPDGAADISAQVSMLEQTEIHTSPSAKPSRRSMNLQVSFYPSSEEEDEEHYKSSLEPSNFPDVSVKGKMNSSLDVDDYIANDSTPLKDTSDNANCASTDDSRESPGFSASKSSIPEGSPVSPQKSLDNYQSNDDNTADNEEDLGAGVNNPVPKQNNKNSMKCVSFLENSDSDSDSYDKLLANRSIEFGHDQKFPYSSSDSEDDFPAIRRPQTTRSAKKLPQEEDRSVDKPDSITKTKGGPRSRKYESLSSEDDQLESFFDKMKKPEKRSNRTPEKKSNKSLRDFIVDSEASSEESDDEAFFLKTTQKLLRPKMMKARRVSACHEVVLSESDDEEDEEDAVESSSDEEAGGGRRVDEDTAGVNDEDSNAESSSDGSVSEDDKNDDNYDFTRDPISSEDSDDGVFLKPTFTPRRTPGRVKAPGTQTPYLTPLQKSMGVICDKPQTTQTPLRTKTPALHEENSLRSHSTGHLPQYTGFLKSLTCDLPPAEIRHPEAVRFIKNFKKTKEDLTKKLFTMYNDTIFNKKMPEDMSIKWNSRLSKTAGFCAYKRNVAAGETRTARVELSVKVCDTAERVRDTLVHELCHAAVWLNHGVNGGHGPFWKSYAAKAMKVHCDLPPISRCHTYEINYKYTYRCTKCGYKLGRHSKSLDTEKKVCGYCHAPFQLLQGTPGRETTPVVPKTPRTPSRFALFVKENYGNIKQQTPGIKHGDVMKQLSKDFAATKIAI